MLLSFFEVFVFGRLDSVHTHTCLPFILITFRYFQHSTCCSHMLLRPEKSPLTSRGIRTTFPAKHSFLGAMLPIPLSKKMSSLLCKSNCYLLPSKERNLHGQKFCITTSSKSILSLSLVTDQEIGFRHYCPYTICLESCISCPLNDGDDLLSRHSLIAWNTTTTRLRHTIVFTLVSVVLDFYYILLLHRDFVPKLPPYTYLFWNGLFILPGADAFLMPLFFYIHT